MPFDLAQLHDFVFLVAFHQNMLCFFRFVVN